MSLDFLSTSENLQHRMLAKCLPDGKVWENKYNVDTNLGKLLLGLAAEYLRLSLLIGDISKEIDINQTSQLIEEWEKSVGIPDDCFVQSGSLEERRRNVLLKLTNFGGIQKASDFVRLATLLGFTASLSNGVANGTFALLFPARFYETRKEATHTIIVDLEESRAVFALDFPMPFTSGVSGIIECLFSELAPSNCQVIYRYGV